MIYLLQVKHLLKLVVTLAPLSMCMCVCANDFRHVRLSLVSDSELHELELTRNPVSQALVLMTEVPA